VPAGTLEGGSPVAGNALLGEGSVVPIEMTLALGEHERSRVVSLMVPSRPARSALTFERHSSAG